MSENFDTIEAPQRRVVEDIKIRNKNNGNGIASDYFGNKITYNDTFKMFADYKKAFRSLDGAEDEKIVIAAPSIVSSVNAFYGAIDANKIAVPVSPGFLNAFTERFTKGINAKTVFVFDSFLSENLINKLHESGVKNVIITSITDYMSPIVKFIGAKKGLINDKDFLDEYVKSGKQIPQDMQFIRAKEFAKAGSKIKEDFIFPYQKDKIAAYFLTGATTSRIPKTVELYADGLNNMAQIYDKLWFDFEPGDIQAVFIPLFYGTGAIHGIHAGLFSGMTLNYKPKYDRFAFGKDLKDSKAKIALVAPSHVATLENSNLKDGELSHVKYIFIGGEAVTPAQMGKFRATGKRLGIEYILNGYGMTETGSMSGISDKNSVGEDVTISPVPGVKYRIVDPETREEVPTGERGILEKTSPCAMAGYDDLEQNRLRFTPDGWINTDDIAVHYGDNKYRVFGRSTDYFTHDGANYAMFDIEEEILKHPGVLEAEVIKFNVNNQEYPAAVVVLHPDWEDRAKDILYYIANMSVDGVNYLLGTRFVDKFKTNPVTAKRDYLSLTDEKEGYYSYRDTGVFCECNVAEDQSDMILFPIEDEEIKIFKADEELTRKRSK